MKVGENINVIYQRKIGKPYFLAGTLLLILITVPAAYGQATYSDIWIDDTNVNEDGEGAVIIGRGVSEVDYTYEDAIEVETTITSPNGRTVTNTVFGELSAQADVELTWDWDDVGDFLISVTRYPVCSDGWYSEEGPMLEHGYNGSTGRIYWYPVGYRRCPRNSFTAFRSFPIGVSYLKMRVESCDPSGCRYRRVEPCDVTCRNMITHFVPASRGYFGECISMHIPYGPLGCLIFVKVTRDATCVCYDTNNN